MTTKRPDTEVFNQNNGGQDATFGHKPDQIIKANNTSLHHSLASSGQGANLLIGGTGTNVFQYNTDTTWPGYAAQNVGDSGNPGPNTLFSLTGYAQNKDVFQGKPGTTNIIWMADGKKALFLDDGFSPGVDSLRFTDITEIQCGKGDQIVDLTSPRYAMGNVTVKGGTGNDVMMASAGNDLLIAGKGNDYMWGGSGNDTFQWESAKAKTFTDIVLGATGVDTLKIKLTSAEYTTAVKAELKAYHDSLTNPANINKTFFFKTVGDIRVSGVERLDVTVDGKHVEVAPLGAKQTIHGAKPNHVLTGGTGADTFFWVTADVGPGKAPDHITNFSFEQGDRVDVSRLSTNHKPASVADVAQTIDQAGGTLVQVHVKGAAAWTDVVVLDNVHSVTATSLYASHNLIL
jgi:Ca2+-binding RTX toxin-like protein